MSTWTLQRPFEVNEINPLRRALFLVFIDDSTHVHKLTYAALQFRNSLIIGPLPQPDSLLRALDVERFLPSLNDESDAPKRKITTDTG
jgi:hypothetical protein